MSDDELRRGRKAEELLNNEAFAAALEKIKHQQFWVFQSSKQDESSKRELAWAMLQALEALKVELSKEVDNAKMAQRAIERAQKNLV